MSMKNTIPSVWLGGRLVSTEMQAMTPEDRAKFKAELIRVFGTFYPSQCVR